MVMVMVGCVGEKKDRIGLLEDVDITLCFVLHMTVVGKSSKTKKKTMNPVKKEVRHGWRRE
jgi:hypothetical protein